MSYPQFGTTPIYKAETPLEYMKALSQQPGVPTPLSTFIKPSCISKTDIDHFPYTRFYVGQHASDFPHIHSRRAGYRMLTNYLYKSSDPSKSCEQYLNPKDEWESSLPFVETIFESGCSKTFPSYHPDNKKPNFMLSYNSHLPNISINNR